MSWTQIADQLNSQIDIMALVEYNGTLYGGTLPNGQLFSFTPGISTGWTQVANDGGGDVTELIQYNRVIYGGINGGKLFSFTPGISTGWTELAAAAFSQSSIHGLVEYNGIIYAGTYPNAYLFSYTPGVSTGWTKVADNLGYTSGSIKTLIEYNGTLYGGTDHAHLVAYTPGVSTGWTILNNNIICSEITALVAYNGVIYGATKGNSGNANYGTDLVSYTPGLSMSLIKLTNTTYYQSWINKLVEYNGIIYAASSIGNEGMGREGLLLSYIPKKSTEWAIVASMLNDQRSIYSLIEHNGILYGGTGYNGKLFSYTPPLPALPGVSHWEENAGIYNGVNGVYSLIEYNGILYSGSDRLLSYTPKEDIQWTAVTDYLDLSFRVFLEYNGNIYGITWGSYTGGRLYVHTPNVSPGWALLANTINNKTWVSSATILNGTIYMGVGDYNGGYLYSYTIGLSTGWTQCATPLNSQTEISSLMAYNGTIYAGTYATANGSRLFSYTPGISSGWTQLATTLNNQRGIASLIEYRGIIYASTGSGVGGCLFSYTPGVSTEWTLLADTFPGGYTYNNVWLTEYNGTIYGITYRGKLLAYTPGISTSWSKMAEYTKSNVLWSETILEYNGTIYCASWDDNKNELHLLEYIPKVKKMATTKVLVDGTWINGSIKVLNDGIWTETSAIFNTDQY